MNTSDGGPKNEQEEDAGFSYVTALNLGAAPRPPPNVIYYAGTDDRPYDETAENITRLAN